MTDLESMRRYLALAEQAFEDRDYWRAAAAAGIAGAFAAAASVEPVNTEARPASADGDPRDLPVPKGYTCAAGCGHSVNIHCGAGCDVGGCDCSASYGRIVPPVETPDDASGLTP